LAKNGFSRPSSSSYLFLILGSARSVIIPVGGHPRSRSSGPLFLLLMAGFNHQPCCTVLRDRARRGLVVDDATRQSCGKRRRNNLARGRKSRDSGRAHAAESWSARSCAMTIHAGRRVRSIGIQGGRQLGSFFREFAFNAWPARSWLPRGGSHAFPHDGSRSSTPGRHPKGFARMINRRFRHEIRAR